MDEVSDAHVPTMSFLRLWVGGASITKPWFIRHLRWTTTKDVIAGVKILCSWICYWRRPVGWMSRCCRLKEGGTHKAQHQKPTREYVPENPDDWCSMKLTSVNVLDWWTLVSQTSCSFCLSCDRVSCTDFREASTEGEIWTYIHLSCLWIFKHMWTPSSLWTSVSDHITV